MIGMRIAEELQLPSRTRSDLFYALLLKDAGCSANASGWPRCSAPTTRRRSARRSCRLVEPLPGVPVVVADRRAGRLAARPRRVPAGSRTRARSRARSWRRAATAAPRSRACSTSPRRPPRRSAASTSTGTAAASPRPARRGDPAARAHPLPRPDRRDLPRRRRRQGRGAVGRAPPRPLVRPGARRRAAAPSAATRLLGDADDPDVSGWEPADRCWSPTTTRLDRIAEAFARVIDAKSPFTARHSERVAELAVGIGGRLGFDAADAARPAPRRRCCTTSASSRSPTGSSTSPAS